MEDRLGLDFYGMDEEKEHGRQRSNAEGEIKNRTKKKITNERKRKRREEVGEKGKSKRPSVLLSFSPPSFFSLPFFPPFSIFTLSD